MMRFRMDPKKRSYRARIPAAERLQPLLRLLTLTLHEAVAFLLCGCELARFYGCRFGFRL